MNPLCSRPTSRVAYFVSPQAALGHRHSDKLVDRQIAGLWADSHHPKIYLPSPIINILEDTTLLVDEFTTTWRKHPPDYLGLRADAR